MTERRDLGSEIAERPSLNTLVNNAHQLFENNEAFVEKDRKPEPYTSYHAALAAIELSGFASRDIYLAVTRETTVQPSEILDNISWSGATDTTTWEEFEKEVNYYIIQHELLKRYPEIRSEEDRRLERYEE